MVRLTDRPEMTLYVYRGRKTTTIPVKCNAPGEFYGISMMGCFCSYLCCLNFNERTCNVALNGIFSPNSPLRVGEVTDRQTRCKESATIDSFH